MLDCEEAAPVLPADGAHGAQWPRGPSPETPGRRGLHSGWGGREAMWSRGIAQRLGDVSALAGLANLPRIRPHSEQLQPMLRGPISTPGFAEIGAKFASKSAQTWAEPRPTVAAPRPNLPEVFRSFGLIPRIFRGHRPSAGRIRPLVLGISVRPTWAECGPNSAEIGQVARARASA